MLGLLCLAKSPHLGLSTGAQILPHVRTYVGPMLAYVGPMLGLCWAHVGPMLGLLCLAKSPHLGLSTGAQILPHVRTYVGPMLAYVGPMLGHVGLWFVKN